MRCIIASSMTETTALRPFRNRDNLTRMFRSRTLTARLNTVHATVASCTLGRAQVRKCAVLLCCVAPFVLSNRPVVPYSSPTGRSTASGVLTNRLNTKASATVPMQAKTKAAAGVSPTVCVPTPTRSAPHMIHSPIAKLIMREAL